MLSIAYQQNIKMTSLFCKIHADAVGTLVRRYVVITKL